jgi:hypothetical protein
MIAERFEFTGIWSIAAMLIVGTVAIYAQATGNEPTGRIAFVGVIRDQTDFAKLGVGKAGYWFPQFDAASPVAKRPTGENARDALPKWVEPLNHVTNFLDPAYLTRTFSQDGPGGSVGGEPKWNKFTLPDGASGLSGAIVDPHARQNTNNTINRIQVRGEAPATFYVHIVTDNTNGQHDPTRRLHLRGNSQGKDFEADSNPQSRDLVFNGIADVYTFRCDGFQSGDFLKLRLSGNSPGGGGPSFGGIMFDTAFDERLSSKTEP